MPEKPEFRQRSAQHYLAIRKRLPRNDIAAALPPLWPDLYAWLAARDVSPAGAPFIRYLVIGRNAMVDVEVGVPVAAAVTGDGRMRGGTLPEGRYAVLVHRGPYDRLVDATAGLLSWARENGVAWDAVEEPKGTAWRARIEHYLTNPEEEPDPRNWITEIALLTSGETTG